MLSSRIVLTAAHCMIIEKQKLRVSEVLVSVGEHDLSRADGEQIVGIIQYHNHPDYIERIVPNGNIIPDNDISILKLKRNVRFSRRTRLCLTLIIMIVTTGFTQPWQCSECC